MARWGVARQSATGGRHGATDPPPLLVMGMVSLGMLVGALVAPDPPITSRPSLDVAPSAAVPDDGVAARGDAADAADVVNVANVVMRDA